MNKKNKLDYRLIIAAVSAVILLLSTVVSALWGFHELSHQDEVMSISANTANISDVRQSVDSLKSDVVVIRVDVGKLNTKVGL